MQSSARVFRLEPLPTAPRLARQRVREVFADLPDGPQGVILLLTSEVVTNAVRHPQPHDGRHREQIEVRLSRTEQVLRVEVTDDDPRPLPAPRTPSDPSESGMGLVLVAELAARWGSEGTDAGDGKVVWFELLLPLGPE